MNLAEGFSTGLNGLAANKLRSGLTMLGIIIGVAAVIAMVSIGEGAKQAITKRIESMGSNLLMVRPLREEETKKLTEITGSSPGLTNEDGLAILKECPSVKNVACEITLNAQAKYLSQDWNTSITGTTPFYQDVKNFHVEEGRFISQQDVDEWKKVCVLGKTVVSKLFEEENPIGKTIKIRNERFVCIGVMETKGQTGWRDTDDVVFIPQTTAQKRFTGNTKVTGLLVQSKDLDGAEAESVVSEIEAVMTKRHKNVIDFEVRSQKEMLDTMQQATQTFKMLLGGIAAISLLVGGIGIMNIMLVSVTERTKEIGLRKAVGAKRRDILAQFLIESVVISMAGGIIGIISGIGLGVGIGKLMSKAMPGGTEWNSIVSLGSIVLAFFFAVGIGIFFGMYPANKASKLDPVEALRYE
ncbi:ABC transporter permease [bacterium]|nr:ABC transporter permease [bacterium]